MKSKSDFVIWTICMVASIFFAFETARKALDHSGILWSIVFLFAVLAWVSAVEAADAAGIGGSHE